MWVNLLIGLSVYLLFVLFRSLRGFEFYHARLVRWRAWPSQQLAAAAAGAVAAVRAAATAAAAPGPSPASPAAAPPHVQLLPAVSRKPPQLKLHGHQRFWGWLLPVFSVTDEELVRSAGLDALIGVS